MWNIKKKKTIKRKSEDISNIEYENDLLQLKSWIKKIFWFSKDKTIDWFDFFVSVLIVSTLSYFLIKIIWIILWVNFPIEGSSWKEITFIIVSFPIWLYQFFLIVDRVIKRLNDLNRLKINWLLLLVPVFNIILLLFLILKKWWKNISNSLEKENKNNTKPEDKIIQLIINKDKLGKKIKIKNDYLYIRKNTKIWDIYNVKWKWLEWDTNYVIVNIK